MSKAPWKNVRWAWSSIMMSVLCTGIVACADHKISSSEERPADNVIDPALLLPWSEITGHIAAFYRTAYSPGGIFFIDGVKRKVSSPGGVGARIYNIALSPDGQQLAIGYATSGGMSGTTVSSIHLALPTGPFPNLERGNPTDLRGYYPAWRSDARLTYRRGDTLFTERSVTAVLRRFLEPHAWAPDDSYILGTSWTEAVPRVLGVYRIRLPDTTGLLITPEEPSISWSSPAIAPHAALVAVKRSSAIQASYSVGEIWVGSVEGGGFRRVHSLGVHGFAWSPDGSHLVVAGGIRGCATCAFMEEPGLFLLNLSDGSFRKLADVPAIAVSWTK